MHLCWFLEGININVLACCVQCSVSCGEGEQSRTVQCKDARNAPSALCDPLTKPVNVQFCRTGIPCPTYRTGFFDSGNNSENGLCFIYMCPHCIHYRVSLWKSVSLAVLLLNYTKFSYTIILIYIIRIEEFKKLDYIVMSRNIFGLRCIYRVCVADGTHQTSHIQNCHVSIGSTTTLRLVTWHWCSQYRVSIARR